MGYVLKAVLSSAQHPEYGQITVPFPIPDEKYDRMIELLEPLEIGDALRQDCRVDELDSFYTVLNRLVGSLVNFDELDYLAKRLDSFDDGEAAQFQGMACKLGVSNIKDFINLTFCCQQATVITDFSDLDAIGRQHYMTMQGGGCRIEELERLDGRKFALDLILNHLEGRITPYGVVYDNPTRSDGNNLLHLINKYMDIYKADPKNLAAKAKAEKYSKILAKTLINTSGGDSAQYGQNAFFYDSAEGLLTAMFLLVAEYLPTEDADGNPIEKRHIVSVFKLVQELLAPSRVKGKNQFQLLLEKLPPNHKARWFAGSALNTAEQAMASVISTVLSRLNAFLDSEMEQILCFDTAIDAEKFCNEKSAIFIVLPEEDQTKYFMVSLILQNLYREILTVADENGGRLKNRVVFFADELGTCPPIQSLELMFSASRSRGLMLVPIVQSITGQLQKNYGKEGSEIIVDNCQVNLYGGFAPASQTAVELSKSLGSRTVMSGSISRGKNDPSQSLQMMERPLMTPDELKSMPKGSFIVAKTGVHPMKVKLRLFLDWGIRFGMPYEVPEKAQRFVAYADKQELEESIIRRHYGTIVMDSEQPQGGGTSAGGMAQGIQAAPDSRKTVFRP